MIFLKVGYKVKTKLLKISLIVQAAAHSVLLKRKLYIYISHLQKKLGYEVQAIHPSFLYSFLTGSL